MVVLWEFLLWQQFLGQSGNKDPGNLIQVTHLLLFMTIKSLKKIPICHI